MADMSRQEIAEYLAEAHVAHLVTVRTNGRPHVAPVWFLEEDTGNPAFLFSRLRRGHNTRASR